MSSDIQSLITVAAIHIGMAAAGFVIVLSLMDIDQGKRIELFVWLFGAVGILAAGIAGLGTIVLKCQDAHWAAKRRQSCG